MLGQVPSPADGADVRRFDQRDLTGVRLRCRDQPAVSQPAEPPPTITIRRSMLFALLRNGLRKF
jgi:hypothetical protein